jgi:hypothetical protein
MYVEHHVNHVEDHVCRTSCKSCKKRSMLQTSDIANWGIVAKKATLLTLLHCCIYNHNTYALYGRVF